MPVASRTRPHRLLARFTAAGSHALVATILLGLVPQASDATPTSTYGQSVAPLGIARGDGASAVAIGVPSADSPLLTDTGEVIVNYGSPDSAGTSDVIFGMETGSQFGFSVAGVGDVNGDGYPDLLVGAPQSSGGAPSSGRAYLYLGTASGYQPFPVWSFTVPDTGAQFGYSVAWAGDVNGDGYADWIVGAPFIGVGATPEAGKAYLFLGGQGVLSTTPAWVGAGVSANELFGISVSGAGDVNGDGYADFLVGAPGATNTFSQEGGAFLWLGHSNGPALAPDRAFWGGIANLNAAYTVAAAGDVNGDGFADFIIGSPFYDGSFTNQGRVQVYTGADVPADIGGPTTITLKVNVAHFGSSIATAGDVNGDGFADIIVGAPDVVNATNHGEAIVYLGFPGGVSNVAYHTFTSAVAGDRVGASVGSLGDWNNDGYGDCVVGATNSAGTGHTLQLLGSPSVPGNAEQYASEGFVAGINFGTTGVAVDVNGDGYDDLVIGTYKGDTSNSNPGSLAFYLGGPHPFPAVGAPPYIGAVPDWTYAGAPQDFLGLSLARAGDVNGDGYDDFIAGAPYHAHPFSSAGEALVFFGAPGGPAASAPWLVEGDAPDVHLGMSVAGGGDFNGDGIADIAVGADNDGTSPAGEGEVFIYYGTKSGLAHTPGLVLHGGQAGCQFGGACAVAGDINGDGYDDLVVGAPTYSSNDSTLGRVFVYFGSASGLPSTPSQVLRGTALNGFFGRNVARVGDLNGDGYADVAVGVPEFSNPESQEGELLIYYGSPEGLVDPPGWTLEDHQVDEFLGWYGIASAGDFNGDGFGDLLVGAPASSRGASNSGRVRVFPGSAAGLGAAPILDESPGLTNLQLGQATGAGDFNGDGFTDLFYTAPGFAAAVGANEGVVYARFGNELTIPAANPDRRVLPWRTDEGGPIATGMSSDAKTSFRLHAHGGSPAGRSRARFEWEVVPLGTPFASTGHHFSSWQPTSSPLTGSGSTATFDALVGGLAAGKGYRWRARLDSDSPLFPSGAWIGPSQAGRTERSLSTEEAAGFVAVDPAPISAAGIRLEAAWPNPSADLTHLAFSVAASGAARLALFDVRGRLVRELFDGVAPAGRTDVTWDGKDAQGRNAPAGLYFARLAAQRKAIVAKLTHLREETR